MHTADIERMSKDLGNIVFNQDGWVSILEKLAQVSRSHGAVLLQSDSRTDDVPRTESLIDSAKKYFGEAWHNRDTRAERGLSLMKEGRSIISDKDILSPDEIGHCAFYQDHLIPHHCDWFAAICFQAGNATWGLSLQRDRVQGHFSSHELALLGSLSERLTEVATLSTLVGRASLHSTLNALNLIQRPAISIGRAGFVIGINELAAPIFSDEFRISGRRLRIKDEAARVSFESLLSRVSTLPEHLPLNAGPMLIRRRYAGSLLMHIFPVDGPARNPFFGARLLLTLTQLSGTRLPQEHTLRHVFGLTAAEARLAAYLASGASPSAASENSKVSKETVRNQLKAIFSKTGTHRQGELAALLARLL